MVNGLSAVVGLAKQADEVLIAGAEAGEDSGQLTVAHVPAKAFAEHGTEVGGDFEIAAFIKVSRVEAGPASVDFAAFHGAAEDEHYISVSVICAAAAVLTGCAS